jgi:hydrogenase maturation protease
MVRIIGIGNPSRGDDAVGLAAAERLRALLPDEVAVHQHARDGASLIHLWEPNDTVVVIDAVISGVLPGTIHQRDLLSAPLPPDIGAITTHTLGLREGVELARALDVLPASLQFIGIEAEDFSMGHGLSPRVRAALEQVVESLISRP